MDKLKTLMGRKIVGVPVLYIVGAAVAVLAYFAFKMKGSATVSSDEPVQDEAEGDLPLSTQPVFTANPPPAFERSDGSIGSTPDVDTNEKWLRRSIEWVSAHEGLPVDSVRIALQKWLAGEDLSVSEGHIRDAAVNHFGLPPEELPQGGQTAEPPVAVPIPDPPVVTPTPSFRPPGRYTTTGTSKDNSWAALARYVYGSGDNDHIDYLQSYNVRNGAPHSGPLPAGLVMWIPVYSRPRYVKATTTMRTAQQLIAKNPPLNSVAMLQELNDELHFPVPVGTRVRVA